MRKTLVIIVAAMAVLVIAGAMARAADLQGTLSGVAGSVEVKTSATGSWTDATDGMKVGQDASIKTGADGEAMLTWGAGNAAQVFPLSIVKVDKLSADAEGTSTSALSLDKGRVMAKAAKLKNSSSTFNIKTPTAVAGVRGTGFDCAMNPASAELTIAVVDGNVVLSVGDVEVSIPAGLMSSVAEGGLPTEPISIPVANLNSLKSTLNKIEVAVKQMEKAEQQEQKKQDKEEKKEEKAEAKEEKHADDAAADDADEDSADDAVAGDVTDAATEAVADEVTDTVIDQAVEDTVTNDITDTVEDLTGCPAGGGCLEGTINIH